MLHRPWVAPLVVGFWAVTCGWLLATKILPTLRSGSAPHAAPAFGADGRLAPVGWTVHWNGNPIGWALTESRRSATGGLTVHSRLRCDRLPLDEILPAWAGSLLQRTLNRAESTTLDAVGRVEIAPGGDVTSFSSTVTLPGTAECIVLEGTALPDGEVRVVFRARDIRYETSRRVAGHLLVGDELSPQATLPGLSEGRRWTVPVYNPLRAGQAALQILHAEAGGEETIFWGNRLVNARVVTYREDPTSPRDPRSRLWVDRSGRVLRHESALLGARMDFVRRTDAEAERLVAVAAALDATAPGPQDAMP